jgi:hypothetical protein
MASSQPVRRPNHTKPGKKARREIDLKRRRAQRDSIKALRKKSECLVVESQKSALDVDCLFGGGDDADDLLYDMYWDILQQKGNLKLCLSSYPLNSLDNADACQMELDLIKINLEGYHARLVGKVSSLETSENKDYMQILQEECQKILLGQNIALCDEIKRMCDDALEICQEKIDSLVEQQMSELVTEFFKNHYDSIF